MSRRMPHPGFSVPLSAIIAVAFFAIVGCEKRSAPKPSAHPPQERKKSPDHPQKPETRAAKQGRYRVLNALQTRKLDPESSETSS